MDEDGVIVVFEVIGGFVVVIWVVVLCGKILMEIVFVEVVVVMVDDYFCSWMVEGMFGVGVLEGLI